MPLTCTIKSSANVYPYTDTFGQLAESSVIVSVDWKLTDGTFKISGGFEISHNYKNEEDQIDYDDSDEEDDPRPDMKALLRGEGKYHRPFNDTTNAMIHATKIQNGVVMTGLYGVHETEFDERTTVYPAEMKDSEGVLCQALKAELGKVIEDLPDYHKDWFVEILA